MENNTDIQPATPESVWIILRDLAASQAETDRLMKETYLQMKETGRFRTMILTLLEDIPQLKQR